MYILYAKVRRRYNRISRGIGTGCASNIEGGRERLLVPGAYIIIITHYYIFSHWPLAAQTHCHTKRVRRRRHCKIGRGLFPGPVSWAYNIIMSSVAVVRLYYFIVHTRIRYEVCMRIHNMCVHAVDTRLVGLKSDGVSFSGERVLTAR